MLTVSSLLILTLGLVYLPATASATTTVVLTRRLAVVFAALAHVLALRSTELDESIGGPHICGGRRGSVCRCVPNSSTRHSILWVYI
jgi:hypothetical protein